MLSLWLDNYLPWFGDLLQLGGGILLFIFFITLVLWVMIIERLLFYQFEYPALAAATLRRWQSRSDRRSWYAQQARLRLLTQAERALKNRLGLISILIKICPLAGLLGTVLGMLDVFDAVAATGANNPRSTAAGVSKATISTMAGMVVAISGLLLASVLTKKADLEQAALSDRLSLDAGQEKQS